MIPDDVHFESQSDHSHGWERNRKHYHKYFSELKSWFWIVEDVTEAEFSDVIRKGSL